MYIILDNTPISSFALTSHEHPTHISTRVHLSFEYNCLFRGGGEVQCFFVLYLKETKRKIVDHSKQFVAICLFETFACPQILRVLNHTFYMVLAYKLFHHKVTLESYRFVLYTRISCIFNNTTNYNIIAYVVITKILASGYFYIIAAFCLSHTNSVMDLYNINCI